VKFRREYTLTVLSEVAVARRGRPFGLGTEAQARDDAEGLNSARAAICTVCGALDRGEAIIFCMVVQYWAMAGQRKSFRLQGRDKAGRGRIKINAAPLSKYSIYNAVVTIEKNNVVS
jgi:hypothetical protein